MNTKRKAFLLLTGILSLGMTTTVFADDLIFDSFEEAEKAALARGAEYEKRMKEHVATVNNAWEDQKGDIGTNSNPDLSKITETRHTEQSSESEANTKLQNSVTESINGLKQQMINTATANTVGFAGASAAYSWSVTCKNGKYVLQDTYDQAFFKSGASGNTTETTTAPANPYPDDDDEPEESASGQNNSNQSDSDSESNDPEKKTGPGSNADPATDAESDTPNKKNPADFVEDKPVETQVATTPDRVVSITVQHPITFEEATFQVTEDTENPTLKLDKNSFPKGSFIPEDTRVKISAKANIEKENSTLTMTIIDDEGESEPIDAESMRNYRHLFRIPSLDEYSVNIYVNEVGSEPRKIMQLCIPVVAVDFDTRTIDVNERKY